MRKIIFFLLRSKITTDTSNPLVIKIVFEMISSEDWIFLTQILQLIYKEDFSVNKII